MKLTYKATTQQGKIQQGIIEAKDVKDAVVYLRSHGLFPIRVEVQRNDAFIEKILGFFNRVTTGDVIFFTRQLSSMLQSGLTLMDSLRVLEEQTQNPNLKQLIHDITLDVEGGTPFSAALAKYPDIFSNTYISLMKAAESSGLLDKILLRLADDLEKQAKLKATIKSALLYPCIVLIGMVIVMTIMMLFVIPQLATVYEGLGVELPLPTRIVIGISDAFVAFWPFFFGFIGLGVFLFRRWYKQDSGKLIIDDFVLRLPIFGNLIKETILAESTRTLSLLIGSGSLVVASFFQVADIAGNVLYKNAFIDVAKRVEKGVTIGDSMASYTLFPPILVQMVKIGEKSGKLDESLFRVSEYFEREVDQRVKTLTTAMDPIIIGILGVGVAFLIISIISPIYNLTSAIK